MPTKVLARCLCGQIEATLDLATSDVHKKDLCHCDSCRHATGVLFLAVVPLTGRPALVNHLTKYQSSPKVERYFCGTCGSHMLCHVVQHDAWDLCTGVVDQILDGPNSLTCYIGGHEFLRDTVDGGLGICLANANGGPLDFFLQGPDQPAISCSGYLSRIEQVSKTPTDAASGHGNEYLQASCHCGGVQYRISRPDARSYQLSSPWPDLIIPSASGHAENDQDVKWWLRTSGLVTRYCAGTCACRSCRLASGVPIQTWAFIPLVNIELLDGSPFDFASGTLKQYTSSEGVYREFCAVCGATAFWHCETRPELIDVSVGLLRAQEGARAENWLEWWTERVSFREEAVDELLVTGFEEGLAALHRKHN
jgi:hypothetical protein